jgi:hypothetical protein
MALQQLNEIRMQSNKFFYTPQVDDLVQKIEQSAALGSDVHVNECIQWHRDQESRYFFDKMDFQTLWPEFSN